MIQRLLYQRLKEGIAAVQADLTIIDQLFVDLFELSQVESDAIKQAFVAKPPSVIHGYAPVESTFPLYSVILGAERETQTYLSDDAGQEDDPESENFGADALSSLWSGTYQIHCCTEHPDLTAYYYEIAKSILITADFTSWGVTDYSISGMDLAPDPRYMPEHIFVRQLTFEAEYEFLRIDRDSKLGKAFSITGLAVDRSGSPRDPGPTKTLVVPYNARQEV